MKKYPILIIGIALVLLYFSCANKNNPAPIKGGGVIDTIAKKFAYSRVNIITTGGNGTFDNAGNLMTVDISNEANHAVLQTATGTNTKVSMVHADGMTVAIYNGGWRATNSGYDASDTTKQPYIRAIQTDSVNKKIIEYRGYITEKTATLDMISNVVPPTMTIATFQSEFSSNLQEVLLPKP